MNFGYIVALQERYKFEKPQKFAGGCWSPKARHLYDLLDEAEQKIADKELAYLYKKHTDKWGKPIKVVKDSECSKCGYSMIVKDGKYGLFYACSQFPACWGTETHPDNLTPDFKEKEPPEQEEDMVVTSYNKRTLKRNGKPVKDGTPTTHTVWFNIDDGPYLLKTRGTRQHLYKGDICSFAWKTDWKGDSVINRKSIKACKKNGEKLSQGDRRAQ
jgi:ssDNA-binding Zn-finger/Zn-ribbon topoisomerase 1